jgi:pimeloyl-ACP methyl ester carboxylesterase
MIDPAAEDNDPDVYALLNQGLALYHADKPFEAHEIWEYAWGVETGRNKLTLQALIQVAAALYKHQVGEPRGTAKLLAKAKAKIEEVQSGASAWLGIDLVRLSSDVGRAFEEADHLASGRGSELSRPHLPRVLGRDGILYLHGFASGPSSAKASMLVPPLASRGYHVAVPDQNEGDFAHLTISRAMALAKRHLRERTLIIGSSLGGYVAALMALKDERIKGMVLMAPAFAIAERFSSRYGEERVQEWRERGSIAVEHYAKKTMQ